MIPMTDSQARYEELLKKLRQRNYRLTPQRVALVRLLSASEGHPSAARLYDQLKAQYPTMSLATVYKTRSQPIQLDLFEEMRVLAATDPALSPKTILEMVTINGARALGMSGQIGELSEKGFADIIAVPCNGTIADICDCVLHHAGPVTGSLIDGQWAVPAQLA